MSKTTAQLVQLAQQNDQDAIEELYRQTYNSVYQTVKTMVKDDDTALDIVQDSFVKGFDNLNQLNEPEKFSAWMRQIAANRARDYLKKKRPTLFTEMENEDGEMQEFADDCMEHLPEEVLDRAETARLVKEILDTLPEEQRAVIFMMHYEQMTVKEIAQALDCSENTVKSRLKYGREKVKVKVEDLAKKGTKLYSLAPMPYLLWLLRMAKTQNIPASTLCPAAETAINAASAAAASQAAQTVGAKAAGETAKSASKTAAKAGAKALSKKIVAGALAVTVAGGAGAVAVNSLHSAERENAAAHAVYEEFLDRYKVALEMDHILFSEMENEEGDAPEFRDDNMDVQPEAVVDRQDTTELISRILSTLGDEQRITIVMFYYQELSVEEIAKAQGCSVNTVKSRLNYGRKKVEKAVLKLEKQGVKLYSMAPFAFFLWLLGLAEDESVPFSVLLQMPATGTAVTGAGVVSAAVGESAAGNAAAGIAVKAASGVFTKAVAVKLAAGALAVSIMGGGVVAATNNVGQSNADDEESINYTEAFEQTDNNAVLLSETSETTEAETQIHVHDWEIVKNIIDNRYTYAQYIAVPATVLSCLGFYQVMGNGTSIIWALMLILGLILSLCAYCLGGLLRAIKSSLSIAKWGWLLVPFPYCLATLPFAFLFAMIAFFLMPIIPIRKAYKENM